ncbi:MULTISPECIES: RNA polymerase sigma factor [Sphingobacterium]|uniref:RNA polymerase sigma factor n=2 Tax=Sphingobacterium TaxID=28453 RepID=UPI000DFA8130|nr:MULTISPECIES: sigma-70 family RNA polymerase sigma factor [Sphingobacterium]MBB1645442.1 hypothetical protein [Sphingobacterium sp. UME9]SUI98006.1 Sigma-24 [Sphingobacterium multivorum]
MKQMSDQELLFLLQKDDQSAFSCLMYRYTEILVRHVSRRLNSVTDAAEIVPDIFLSLWNKRRDIYTAEDSLYPYLFKAAKYEVINRMIKNNRMVVNEQLLAQSYKISYTSSIEEDMIAEELKQILYQAVEKMPETMKTIFYLSREECLSVKDIALTLSLSEQTVKNNLTSALKHLRFVIRRNHYSTLLLISFTIHINNTIS